jgi:hypothetical protein
MHARRERTCVHVCTRVVERERAGVWMFVCGFLIEKAALFTEGGGAC